MNELPDRRTAASIVLLPGAEGAPPKRQRTEDHPASHQLAD